MTKLNHYELCAIEALKPYPGNPRVHSPKQIKQIADSIVEFGWMNPALVDEHDNILAGHGRLLAAKQLDLPQVPVILIKHLSEAEKTAYRLADNKLTENAGWDPGMLKIELEILMDPDIDIDIGLTGFSDPEVDMYLGFGDAVNDHTDGGEALPNPPDADKTVTHAGDVWVLNDHRVICGDCRDPATVDALMTGILARMVISDPPYNLPINGHVSGHGKHQHAEFAMASGEMDPEAFIAFLMACLSQLTQASVSGSLHYIFMDWRHLTELLAAGKSVYDELKNLCVWVKSNGGMGSFYRSQHELVLIFKLGTGAHINNVQLGQYGRYRTNVWAYPGANAFGPDRDAALAMHPTVKPTPMIADAILDASAAEDIVLDGFLGSGTTLIAAELTRRRCYGIEIDPRYVDVSIKRWQTLTHQAAVHSVSGLSFDEAAVQRLEDQAELCDE